MLFYYCTYTAVWPDGQMSFGSAIFRQPETENNDGLNIADATEWLEHTCQVPAVILQTWHLITEKRFEEMRQIVMKKRAAGKPSFTLFQGGKPNEKTDASGHDGGGIPSTPVHVTDNGVSGEWHEERPEQARPKLAVVPVGDGSGSST